ncbi:pleckstrin homology-like domain family A member 2 [Carcharodon carcharias]|uniref:pleckstrin homology-like domain family A member 2 n=1 Tax=Carcharodon carcharias TaxID=13397 RepID=UPI001B7DAEDD|nr:pleckstrin homology-like domain family A member 2 [Carcharodon carcharias]
MKGPTVTSGAAIKEGKLEKRSENLFQLWKKKQCTLTKESLLFANGDGKGSRPKELSFDSIWKLECVERKGTRVYFTIVTTDQREIDFRCEEGTSWNAAITMALVAFKNEQAVREFRSRKPARRWRAWAS